MNDTNPQSSATRKKRAVLLSELERSINYRFRDRQLLYEALIHRSYAAVSRRRGIPDNQRLEFFGDSVLGFFVSSLLLELFPQCCEGELSRRKSSLVETSTLAGLARQLDLGRYLLLSRGEEKTGGRKKKTVLAAAFEALLAAVFLDGGSVTAELLVKKMYGPLLAGDLCGDLYRDYKTKLQELSQALHSQLPCYFLDKIDGPDHNLCFTVTVMAGNECFARGTGKTRKEAEQSAAREGIVLLEELAARKKVRERA